MYSLEQKIEELQLLIRSMQADLLFSDHIENKGKYKKAVLELAKLRRRQTRRGRPKPEDGIEP